MSELSDEAWQAIGLSRRLQLVHYKMWCALVEERKHIKIFADDELLAEVNMDHTRDVDGGGHE